MEGYKREVIEQRRLDIKVVCNRKQVRFSAAVLRDSYACYIVR